MSEGYSFITRPFAHDRHANKACTLTATKEHCTGACLWISFWLDLSQEHNIKPSLRLSWDLNKRQRRTTYISHFSYAKWKQMIVVTPFWKKKSHLQTRKSRCGIMHARNQLMTSRQTATNVIFLKISCLTREEVVSARLK